MDTLFTIAAAPVLSGTMVPETWTIAAVTTQMSDLLGAGIFLGVLALGLGIRYAGKVFRLIKSAGK